MSSSIALAYEVVRGVNLLVTYLQEQQVSSSAFAESVERARQQGREWDLDDLRELVAEREAAVAELDAEIARRRQQQARR